MKWAIIASLAASVWFGAPCAYADTAPLRLADVIEEARSHNPGLQAARERSRALAAVPAQVSAYDDPTVSWEAWNFPNSFQINHADNNIFRLSQRIPFPGKRTLAGRMAERDAKRADRQVDGAELDVVTQVKRAYFDLWMAYQNIDTYRRDKGLMQNFFQLAQQRYASGEAPQSDALRAQVELTHEANMITTEALAIDTARAELNALLSREPDAPLGVPEDSAPPRLEATSAELIDLALQTRPELAAQSETIAREEAGVELAHRNYYPDFEFSFGRFVNYGQSDGFGAIAAVTIPLAYKSKYDAGVTAANAQLGSARADLRGLQDTVRRDVEQAFLRVRTALLQHDLFIGTHIPQAEQALRVTAAAYQAGQADFLALIDALRAIEAVHLEHVKAAAELQKAFADLERAVGTDLAHGGTAHTVP